MEEIKGPDLGSVEEKYIYMYRKVARRLTTRAHGTITILLRNTNDSGYYQIEKRTDASKYDSFHARFYGRISELLLDVWINKNQIKYEEVKVMDMQKVNWWKKGISFLRAKFTGKKYEKSF
mgnify:CR=1 FL=1